MSSIFIEKGEPPDDAGLAEALGRAKAHWDAILAHVAAERPRVKPEWKFYGEKYGWQLKLMGKRKALLYLVPHRRSFLAGMALRASEVERLREARLPEALVEEIESAKPFQEGWPARIEVRTKKHVETIRRLLTVRDP